MHLTTRRVALVGLAMLLTAVAAAVLLVSPNNGTAVNIPPAPPAVARYADCDAPFRVYNLGTSYAGEEMIDEATDRRCDKVEPIASEAAGGEIDPDSLIRANYVSYIYGDCEAGDDQGCLPPYEVKVYPACEHNPTMWNRINQEVSAEFGEDVANGNPRITSSRPITKSLTAWAVGEQGHDGLHGGAPERVETVIGDVTVAVYATPQPGETSAELTNRMFKMAGRLQSAGTSLQPDTKAPLNYNIDDRTERADLPNPDPRATAGTLACTAPSE